MECRILQRVNEELIPADRLDTPAGGSESESHHVWNQRNGRDRQFRERRRNAAPAGRRRARDHTPMNAKTPSIDFTQGFAQHVIGLNQEEYRAAVSNPAYLSARRAHARKLPDALGKEDYAEYLALAGSDYSMEQIAEKLRAYTPGSWTGVSFSEFLDRKAGRAVPKSPVAAPGAAAIAAASPMSLWDEVVAEINAAQNGVKR
jgi:hypothetical protein